MKNNAKVKAWGVASVIFVFLGGATVEMWRLHFFSVVDSRVVLGLALICVALISHISYQWYIARYTTGNDGRAVTVHDMLRSLEDLFIKMFKNSPVPYVLIDKKGAILLTNTAAVRLFGFLEEELAGRSLFQYLQGEDEQRTALLPGKFEQGLFVNDQELSVMRKDGAVRWVLFSLFSFTDSKGYRRGMATLVDITKQREIDKAKSEFVSLASHQLRTPIAAIKWNIELLLLKHAARLSPEERAYIDAAALALHRMDVLVDDFLNVSRFELGTLVAEKTTFELVPFLEGVMNEYTVPALQKKIVLEKAYDAGIALVTSDSHLLGMAVGNLLSNAIKYTPERGVVRLEAHADTHELHIHVRDTGMGIPLDEQDKIFSKIFRASNAQAHVPDGTGLGLYIAHEAVKVLGGSIRFVSEEYKGTTFTTTLPLV